MSAERSRRSGPPRVLIAGAGVAGLETLLALRALAGDRVDITAVAPAPTFVNEAMSVDRPFKPQRGRGIRLERMLAEFDARWVRGAIDHVESGRRVAVTREGEQLPYDKLVVATGARPKQWVSSSLVYRSDSHALSYRGDSDSPDYRLLLKRLHEGRVSKLAFVRPPGPSWPLPLYDLALMTGAQCAARGDAHVELSLVTPEEEPLGIFGRRASAAIRALLEKAGVVLHTDSYGETTRRGWLEISPGDRGMKVDRVVTEPRLVGAHLRGLPCDSDGFIATEAHGGVPGLPGVFAAGDATSFPVKQGGLAAQQADAVAETVAASVGIDIEPQPFRPVLRGVLLTGGHRAICALTSAAGRAMTRPSPGGRCGGLRTSWPGATSLPTSATSPARPPTSCPRMPTRFPLRPSCPPVGRTNGPRSPTAGTQARASRWTR